MSITKETVQAHLKDPAIFCCRREKGLVISEKDLEDPGLFDDMIDSGLLELSGDGLTIEQVLGCTLMKDCEALVPITRKKRLLKEQLQRVMLLQHPCTLQLPEVME